MTAAIRRSIFVWRVHRWIAGIWSLCALIRLYRVRETSLCSRKQYTDTIGAPIDFERQTCGKRDKIIIYTIWLMVKISFNLRHVTHLRQCALVSSFILVSEECFVWAKETVHSANRERNKKITSWQWSAIEKVVKCRILMRCMNTVKKPQPTHIVGWVELSRLLNKRLLLGNRFQISISNKQLAMPTWHCFPIQEVKACLKFTSSNATN